MFETIVVGTDGSANARKALEVAADCASANGAKVHVVTSYHPLSADQLAYVKSTIPQEFWPSLHSHYGAESRLADALDILERGGVAAMTHELDKDPTDAMIDVATEHDADLIIVGSRGEHAVKRLLHGSVSTKVIHHAPCSVLVVRDDP